MSSEKKNTRDRILEATWRLMEKHCGQNVRMSDIAKAANVSRQAVYLHFESRTELMIATTRYVDEVKGLDERLKLLQTTKNGTELLEAVIEVWGNYIPEIYGIAKALLNTRDTDEATATAWNGCMRGLRDACESAIDTLHNEDMLASEWSKDEAIQLFWTTLSVHNWEQLTTECGWSTSQYVQRTKIFLNRALIDQGTK